MNDLKRDKIINVLNEMIDAIRNNKLNLLASYDVELHMRIQNYIKMNESNNS